MNLTCDGPLSNFAFNFNLRRYSMAGDLPVDHFVTHSIDVEAGDVAAATTKAGRCRSTPG